MTNIPEGGSSWSPGAMHTSIESPAYHGHPLDRDNVSQSSTSSLDGFSAGIVLRYSFCCSATMPLRSKMGVGFVWLVLIAVLTGVVTRFFYFQETAWQLVQSDIRHAQRGVSVSFCESVIFEQVSPQNSSSLYFSTYMFEEEPPLNRFVNNHFSLKDVTLAPGTAANHTFYLQRGSDLAVGACTRQGNIRVLILKGDWGWNCYHGDDWYGDEKIHCAVDYQDYYDYRSHCSQLRQLGRGQWWEEEEEDEGHRSAEDDEATINIIANDPDYYHVVIQDIHTGAPSVSQVDIALRRRTYDLHDPKATCSSRYNHCKVDLTYGRSRMYILVQAESVDPNDLSVLTVASSCTPRIGMYVVFFFIIPLVCLMAYSCLVTSVCKMARGVEEEEEERRARSHSPNTNGDLNDERTPLLSPSAPLLDSGQRRMTTLPAPPAYDDVMSGSDTEVFRNTQRDLPPPYSHMHPDSSS